MVDKPPQYHPGRLASPVERRERIVVVEVLILSTYLKSVKGTGNLMQPRCGNRIYHVRDPKDIYRPTRYVEPVSIKTTQNMIYQDLTNKLNQGVIKATDPHEGKGKLVDLEYVDIIWQVNYGMGGIEQHTKNLKTILPVDNEEKMNIVLRSMDKTGWRGRFVLYYRLQ